MPAASRGADPAVVVDDLCVDVQAEGVWHRIVDHVSFVVDRGEAVGLVGESGSGKSMTAMALTGLLPRTSSRVTGSVILGGRDLVQLPERALADVRGVDVGMIFQAPRPSLNPAFTVGDQVAETLRRHRSMSRRAAWRRALELLDDVGIPDPPRRAHQYPHQFSGGMCQRAMIAIALACDPYLLIADEPTTALDVTVQAQVLALLTRLRVERGLGLLLISHDLAVVAETCQRVLVMYAGELVETATLDALLERPLHPYTEALTGAVLGDTADVRAPLTPIPGEIPLPGSWPQGCRFHPRCAFAEPGRCDDAHPGAERFGPRSVRCVRAHELVLDGVRT